MDKEDDKKTEKETNKEEGTKKKTKSNKSVPYECKLIRNLVFVYILLLVPIIFVGLVWFIVANQNGNRIDKDIEVF